MLSLTDPLQVREEYRDNHGRFDTLAKKDTKVGITRLSLIGEFQ